MAAQLTAASRAHGAEGIAGAESLATPAARSALIRLCAAAVVAYCSYAMCRIPLLPLFAHELGAGPSLVGLVMGASTLTGIFVKLPAGALSDLFGRRRLLLAGALVFASMPFTYLGVSTLALLIVLRFLHGSATAMFGPVASASLSDIAPRASRGAWLSMYSTAQGAGQAIGPVIAGYLIAAGRFDLAFVTAGIVGLGVPLIVAGLGGAPAATSRRGSWPEFKQGVLEVGRDRLVLVTSAAQAAQFVLNGTLNAFLPLYGREVLGLTAAQLGWLFAVQTLTTPGADPSPKTSSAATNASTRPSTSARIRSRTTSQPRGKLAAAGINLSQLVVVRAPGPPDSEFLLKCGVQPVTPFRIRPVRNA
jgi:MFS family permease